ncbi:MAG: hypothetical protein ACRDM7_13110 [Thermoleophilaceae bacterium]
MSKTERERDAADGCDLDFKREPPTTDAELERLLDPEQEEG